MFTRICKYLSFGSIAILILYMAATTVLEKFSGTAAAMKWGYHSLPFIALWAVAAVCGAACIESYTPADNTGDPFDDRMQQHRNRTPVKHEPELAARLVGFARRAANLIRHEGFVTPTYVMDVAFIDGQPGIIELNGISNAGLYALDMTTLLTAVKEHPEQFTPATPLATPYSPS